MPADMIGLGLRQRPGDPSSHPHAPAGDLRLGAVPRRQRRHLRRQRRPCGFAFVFIPALEIIAGYSPVVAGSALVPVTVVTMLLSGASGRLAQRTGPRPPLVADCLACAGASMLAVRIGSHAGYWTVVFSLAVLFGLGLASLIPPLTASAMNSAPDSLAGLASGVNNAVARVADLLWIAALPPITGLTGPHADAGATRSARLPATQLCSVQPVRLAPDRPAATSALRGGGCAARHERGLAGPAGTAQTG